MKVGVGRPASTCRRGLNTRAFNDCMASSPYHQQCEGWSSRCSWRVLGSVLTPQSLEAKLAAQQALIASIPLLLCIVYQCCPSTRLAHRHPLHGTDSRCAELLRRVRDATRIHQKTRRRLQMYAISSAWLTFFMGDIRFPSRSAPLQHDTHSYSTGRGTIRYSTAGDPCAILMASCQDDWFDRSAPRTCVSWFAYGVGGGEAQAGQSCTGWLRNFVGTAAIANVELSQLALPRPFNTMLSALCLFFLLLAMSPTGACGVRTGCFMFSLRTLYTMRSVLMEQYFALIPLTHSTYSPWFPSPPSGESMSFSPSTLVFRLRWFYAYLMPALACLPMIHAMCMLCKAAVGAPRRGIRIAWNVAFQLLHWNMAFVLAYIALDLVSAAMWSASDGATQCYLVLLAYHVRHLEYGAFSCALVRILTPANRGRLFRALGFCQRADTRNLAAVAALIEERQPCYVFQSSGDAERRIRQAAEAFLCLPWAALEERDLLASTCDPAEAGRLRSATRRAELGSCDVLAGWLSWHGPRRGVSPHLIRHRHSSATVGRTTAPRNTGHSKDGQPTSGAVAVATPRSGWTRVRSPLPPPLPPCLSANVRGSRRLSPSASVAM